MLRPTKRPFAASERGPPARPDLPSEHRRAYYVGEDEGWNFIVFEFMKGSTCDLVEQNGPLPIEDALNYTMQVAEALDHAAGRDVVHPRYQTLERARYSRGGNQAGGHGTGPGIRWNLPPTT